MKTVQVTDYADTMTGIDFVFHPEKRFRSNGRFISKTVREHIAANRKRGQLELFEIDGVCYIVKGVTTL